MNLAAASQMPAERVEPTVPLECKTLLRFRGTPADIQIAAREILELTRRMAEIISRHSGRPVDQVMTDIDRDRFMNPSEAIEYGLIDAVMETRGAPVTKAA